MRKGQGDVFRLWIYLKNTPSWLRHVVAAALYGIAYTLLSGVSVAHWAPQAGLRVACLLLTPFRYWPALLIGETFAVSYNSYRCLDRFGAEWALAHSFPLLALAMPVVWQFRKRIAAYAQQPAIRMGLLLLCSLIVALLEAVTKTGTFTLMRLPVGYVPTPLNMLVGEYFLGSYLGILMVAIPAVMLQSAIRDGGMRTPFQHLSLPKILEVSAVALVFAALVWAGLQTTGDTRQLSRMVMFLPVAWCALRYGWQGAGVAGTVASLGVFMTMPTAGDTSTIQAQAFIGFATTTMLMLGARTTNVHQLLRETWQSLQLSRQELYFNELNRQRSAQELKRVQTSLDLMQRRLLPQLQYFQAGTDERNYLDTWGKARLQLSRVADSLSPQEWQRLGHPHALWGGPIAKLLADLGVAYEVDPGGQMSHLTPDISMALYRLACEAVAHLLVIEPTNRIVLKTSTSENENGMWGELEIGSEGMPIARPSKAMLLDALGAAGLNEAEMRQRTAIYDGSLSFSRSEKGAAHISIRLRDSVKA